MKLIVLVAIVGFAAAIPARNPFEIPKRNSFGTRDIPCKANEVQNAPKVVNCGDNSIVAPDLSTVKVIPYPPSIPGNLGLQFTANFKQQVDLTNGTLILNDVESYVFFNWVNACKIPGLDTLCKPQIICTVDPAVCKIYPVGNTQISTTFQIQDVPHLPGLYQGQAIIKDKIGRSIVCLEVCFNAV